MILLQYILATVLLSLAGLGIYLVFRLLRPGPALQRGMIWAILLLSLGIPLAWPAAAHRHTGASSAHEYCRCEDPGTGDVLRWHASRVQDVLLEQGGRLTQVLVMAGLLLAAVYLLRMLLLERRLRRAASRPLAAFTQVRTVAAPEGLRAGAFRLLRPWLLWDTALEALSTAEQAAIQAHELAHLRLHHTWERLALMLMAPLWLLNPAWYFFRRELSHLAEFQADDAAVRVLGDRRAYAALLLRVYALPGGPVVAGWQSGDLKARVMRLVQAPRPPRRAVGLLAGILLLTAGESVAQSWVRAQVRDMRLYERLQEVHAQTGEETFCRRCALEDIGEVPCE